MAKHPHNESPDTIGTTLKTFKGKILWFVISLVSALIFTIIALTFSFIHTQQEIMLVYKHVHEVQYSSAWENDVIQQQYLATFGISLVTLIVIALSAWGLRSIIHSLSQKIQMAHVHITALAEGNLVIPLTVSSDEFGPLYAGINSQIQNLMRLRQLAEAVGQGHFDTEIAVFNPSSALGMALAEMRHSLKAVATQDHTRNWISEGIAKFAQLLRQQHANIDALCDALIKDLVKYVNANQGAVFISEIVGGQTLLNMKACYAYGRKKHIEKTIRPGQGLAGQVFEEGETLYLTEIPPDYFTITSGLGDSYPRCLLVVPLKLNEATVGIIELASLQLLRPEDIAFVEKLAESIASTIRATKASEETRRLLHDSMSSAEQLKAQEEELRQNLEEIQATQEQLQRQTEAMRAIQDKLMLEKSMFTVLMEYLPDRLTYKDTESKVIRVNKAKAKRFNLEPDQMIGTSDFDFFPAAHAQKARDEEVELMKQGNPMLDIQEKVSFDDGRVMFINTSRIPFKNESNKLLGVFIISRDITQQKLQEAQISHLDQLFKGLLSLIPAFSYKVDKEGTLEIIHMGHTMMPPMPYALEKVPVDYMIPDFNSMLQLSADKTLLKMHGTLVQQGETLAFTHYILPDSVYHGVYWGFAVQDLDTMQQR